MSESNFVGDLVSTVVRDFDRNVAIKLSSLTKAEIYRLADNELSDLINEKLSQLPQAEIDGIVFGEIENFLAPILSFLFSPIDEEVLTPPPSPAITLPAEQHHSSNNWTDLILLAFLGLAGLTIKKLYKYLFIRRLPKRGYATTIEEFLELSKRYRSLSQPKPVYARISDIVFKGLKAFREPYIPETSSMVLSQHPGVSLEGIGEPYIPETSSMVLRQGLKGIGEPYIQKTNIVFRQDLPTEGRAASERDI